VFRWRGLKALQWIFNKPLLFRLRFQKLPFSYWFARLYYQFPGSPVIGFGAAFASDRWSAHVAQFNRCSYFIGQPKASSRNFLIFQATLAQSVG
jgi:hypothetical protein